MAALSRRGFALGTLGAGIALGAAPALAQAAAPAAGPVAAGPYAHVAPELVAPLRQMPTMDITAANVPMIRGMASPPPLAAPAPQPVMRTIPGPSGAPDLRVVIVDPSPGAKGRPAYLHIHGGGYVIGSAMQFIHTVQATAQACGCLIVSVDYRLAPETRFPGALEDNYAALRWLHANADELGVDRARIAVGGESAGGGHAAMLAIAARDRREVPIAFQLLIYPMLDDRTGSSRPVAPHLGQFIWTSASNRYGWTSLLGVAAGSPTAPAGAVPARVENLRGLPPTFIGVGALDLFAEEDVEYARRLIGAGVPTETLVVPGAYHGFDLLAPTAAVSQRFVNYGHGALRRGLGLA